MMKSTPTRIRLLALLGFALLTVGCHRSGSNSADSGAPASSSVAAHDPSHPPIDCPLRKAGIHPGDLKPFETTEKYIAFLDRPERELWQKPAEVVASLQLSGAETVVDIGAGSGYFTFRFAKVLPKGRVIASDVDPEMVRHIHHRAMSEGIGNVEVTLGDPSDPKIPAGAQLLFLCDVLHHVQDRGAWLGRLHKEASPGVRLVIVEFKEGPLPEGPPEGMKLPRNTIVREVTQAGFDYSGEGSIALPYQVLLQFRKR